MLDFNKKNVIYAYVQRKERKKWAFENTLRNPTKESPWQDRLGKFWMGNSSQNRARMVGLSYGALNFLNVPKPVGVHLYIRWLTC